MLRGEVIDFTVLDFLDKYHNGNTVIKKKHELIQYMKQKKRKCRRKKKKKFKSNPYNGALYLPMYGALVKAQANNELLQTDILGLAKPKHDNSSHCSHGVLSSVLAEGLTSKADEMEHKLKRIPQGW
eukprot:2681442-Ditylum_brightwellii.AAC.2